MSETDHHPPRAAGSGRTGAPPPGGPAPPGRKGLSRGCWIAATVVGSILLLCGGGLSVVAYTCWQDPEVRRAARAVGEGFTVMREAMNAPGTEALRRAGCDSALVLTPEQLWRIVEAASPDAGRRGRRELPSHRSVVCQVGEARAMSCERVARTYGDAVDQPPAEFALAVQQVGGREVFCDGVYAPDGRRLGELGDREARTMGQVGVGR